MESLVVFANGGAAAKHKARHAWGVMRVTAVGQYGGSVSVCGVVDGVEVASGIEPSDLAEPGESTGWLGVHYAVGMGCGLGVVGAVLDAHPEVTSATLFLFMSYLCPCATATIPIMQRVTFSELRVRNEARGRGRVRMPVHHL